MYNTWGFHGLEYLYFSLLGHNTGSPAQWNSLMLLILQVFVIFTFSNTKSLTVFINLTVCIHCSQRNLKWRYQCCRVPTIWKTKWPPPTRLQVVMTQKNKVWSASYTVYVTDSFNSVTKTYFQIYPPPQNATHCWWYSFSSSHLAQLRGNTMNSISTTICKHPLSTKPAINEYLV